MQDLNRQFFDRFVGWAVLGIIILLQWLLFHQYVNNEVAWTYPRNHDQANYLQASYETYDLIRRDGVFSGLRQGVEKRRPTGLLLHLQGSIFLIFFGPSRLGNLAVNFFYFALLQIVVVWVLRWLSRSWVIPLLGLGLLMTIQSPFLPSGGLADFRIDFVVFCLYGVFIGVVIRSYLFRSPRWAIVAGVVAAVLVLFRYITAVYLLGIYGLFFLLLLVKFNYTDQSDNQSVTRSQLLGMIYSASILLVIVLPALIHSGKRILTYYLGQMFIRSSFRALQTQTTSLGASLLFYPLSLVQDHIGFLSVSLGITFVILSTMLGIYSPSPTSKVVTTPLQLDKLSTSIFLGAAFFVPLIVLIPNKAKSPIVGNILVMPVFWYTLMIILSMFNRVRASTNSAVGFTLLMFISVSFGAYHQINALTRAIDSNLDRKDHISVAELWNTVVLYSDHFGWYSPRVASTSGEDFLSPSILTSTAYEQHSIFLDTKKKLRNFNPLSDADSDATLNLFLAELNDNDFVVFSRSPIPTSDITLLPFDDAIWRWQDELYAFITQNYVLIQRQQVLNREVELFVKPAVEIVNEDAAWVTSTGLELAASTPILREYPIVRVCGSSELSVLDLNNFLAKASLVLPGYKPLNASTATVAANNSYCLFVFFDSDKMWMNSLGNILLSFDTHFVPQELGINSDATQLVVQMPNKVVVLQRQNTAHIEADGKNYLIDIKLGSVESRSVEMLLQLPDWGIEADDFGSLLWLGDQVDYGLSGIIHSPVQQDVNIELTVAPGPARHDTIRNVKFKLTSSQGTRTFQKQFDQMTTLSFPITLFPGKNKFAFEVLDQATIKSQPNGDTRPLMVQLRHFAIAPDES